jgi:hypothetical protein
VPTAASYTKLQQQQEEPAKAAPFLSAAKGVLSAAVVVEEAVAAEQSRVAALVLTAGQLLSAVRKQLAETEVSLTASTRNYAIIHCTAVVRSRADTSCAP